MGGMWPQQYVSHLLFEQRHLCYDVTIIISLADDESHSGYSAGSPGRTGSIFIISCFVVFKCCSVLLQRQFYTRILKL